MDLTRVAPSLALLVVGSTVLPSIANAEVLEFVMTLDGSQQNPVIDTPGTGSGVASLDTDTNLFSWDVTFSGLLAAQTAAHFHGPAEQCEPGGIAIPLPVGSPIVGSSTVTAQQATQIMDGLWYLNVHSSMHPGGEIRGQVMPAPTDDPLPDPVPPGGIHLQLDTIVDGLTAPNWDERPRRRPALRRRPGRHPLGGRPGGRHQERLPRRERRCSSIWASSGRAPSTSAGFSASRSTRTTRPTVCSTPTLRSPLTRPPISRPYRRIAANHQASSGSGRCPTPRTPTRSSIRQHAGAAANRRAAVQPQRGLPSTSARTACSTSHSATAAAATTRTDRFRWARR